MTEGTSPGAVEGSWGRGTEAACQPLAAKIPGAIVRPRIAVIGCGYWGSKHVRVLSGLPGLAGIAVVDPDRSRREAVLSAFPAVRSFRDLAAALREVDAVIVATPPRSHAEAALEALRQGKHVMVEKPLATSVAEARLLLAEARRTGAVLMVGHTFEFNSAVRELKRRLERGELGEVYYIHSARLNLGLYRSDVNVIWDLAPHDISILNYLLGSIPTTVSAWGSTNAWAGLEDLAYIRLEYEHTGVTGYVHVSWLDPKKVRNVTVVGSRKMAVYDDMAEERLRIFDRGVDRRNDDQAASHQRPLSYRYGDIVSPHICFEEPLALEDQHFVDCIRTRRTPQSDGRSGLAVVAVLEAIDRSLKSGRCTSVDWPTEPAPMINGQAVHFPARSHP